MSVKATLPIENKAEQSLNIECVMPCLEFYSSPCHAHQLDRGAAVSLYFQMNGTCNPTNNCQEQLLACS